MLVSNKVSRKQQLEIIATELFKEKGYNASSMRDLANKVGIEAASLYSHIKSKEEILQKICFRKATEFFDAIDKIEIEDIPASVKLKKAILAHISVIVKDTAAASVFFSEWKYLSEPFYSDFLTLRENYEDRYQKIIKEGKTSGEFIAIDEKFAVLSILAALNWIPNWFDPKGKMTPADIGEQLSEMLINGLIAK